MNRHSFSIYDASAGSGKTFTLVKEYLKILLTTLQKDIYRNILAITFTNKAVGEMKSRVVNNLSEFTKENPDKKAMDLMLMLVQETGLTLFEIKNKSQIIIKDIIHNYASFDISTIDKFTHKVIRTFAHDLNLPITFDVSIEIENLLMEAVDAIISKTGEDQNLTRLLVDFTMEKTDDDKSWDITRDIFDISRLLINENNRNEIVHFQDKSIDEFIEIKNELLKTCKSLERSIISQSGESLRLIKDNNIEHSTFTRGLIPNYLVSLKEGNIEKRENLLKYLEEGNRYAKTKPSSQKEALDNIVANLISIFHFLFQSLEKYLLYKAFLKNITPLSLLNMVSQEFSKIQQEQNVLSISEFNTVIYKEIQNQPAPFIYERLGERYRHFFIDEFQDTSEIQWLNLIPLIDNAISSEYYTGDRGSLVIVGDPKQAIYRWRGGKAEQFIALSKDYNPFNNSDKILEHLDQNYRSYSEIIAFNNGFFQLLSHEFMNPDYKDLYANHSKQKVNDKIGGYVSISFIPNIDNESEERIDKTEQYLLSTLETIQKVNKKGFDYKEIVILTRKKNQGITIANYLTENRIPILSSETLMICNATEVKLIISILRYLINSEDLEAKANFLQYMAEYIQDQLPIHDFIALGVENKGEKKFEQWLKTFDISLSFQSLRRKSLYESVEIIISKLLKPNQINAYVQSFLDLVLEKNCKDQAGINDFLEYWDKNGHKFSIPSSEGSDAVRIMTIHKSKGLEFPVVIIPFAEEDYSRKPKDKLWLDIDKSVFGLPKILIDNNSNIVKFGETASIVYLQKKEEELLDNINILYVALTRAEEQLYIISSMNLSSKGETPKNNMSAFFTKYLESLGYFSMTCLEYSWGSSDRVSLKKESADSTKTIPFVRNTLDNRAIKIAQKEMLMWGTYQQKAIEYGNVIHEILSFVKTKGDVDLAITKALERGLITGEYEVDINHKIQQIVTHPELACYFNPDFKVFNEQIIIQNDGYTIKPDKIILNNKDAYLLDYKTGGHDKKYLQQLVIYQEVLEKMGYSVVRKVLVYISDEIKVMNL